MARYVVSVEVDVEDVEFPSVAAALGWEAITELENPVVEVRLVGDAEPGDGLLYERLDEYDWREYSS